jgi:hypothetical protein
VNARLVLTLAELERRSLVSPERLEQLLVEDLRRGLVERVGDAGWRLTAQAERRHGRHLRELAREERSA